MNRRFFYCLTCIVLFKLFFILQVSAQEKSVAKKPVFSGTIYDIETLEVLPFSQVIVNKKTTRTDSAAFFIMKIPDYDTITIRHSGYYDSKIIVSDLLKSKDSVHIDVLMKRQFYELNEIDLFSYKTFAEFKRAVLNTDVSTKEGNAVQKNVEVIKKQLKNDFMPYDDGYMNYRMNNLDNGGVVFFSNGYKKGLVSAIKKLIKH